MTRRAASLGPSGGPLQTTTANPPVIRQAASLDQYIGPSQALYHPSSDSTNLEQVLLSQAGLLNCPLAGNRENSGRRGHRLSCLVLSVCASSMRKISVLCRRFPSGLHSLPSSVCLTVPGPPTLLPTDSQPSSHQPQQRVVGTPDTLSETCSLKSRSRRTLPYLPPEEPAPMPSEKRHRDKMR